MSLNEIEFKNNKLKKKLFRYLLYIYIFELYDSHHV